MEITIGRDTAIFKNDGIINDCRKFALGNCVCIFNGVTDGASYSWSAEKRVRILNAIIIM